jgi:pyruvate kinase
LKTDWRLLLQQVKSVEAESAAAAGVGLRNLPEQWRASAANLRAYLALRRLDVRKLQFKLAENGLSSLGRSEGYVRHNLAMVRRRIEDALGRRAASAAFDSRAGIMPSPQEAENLLHDHTRAIFGPKPKNRHIYIMVTAPEPAIADEAWFVRMLSAGMNILRINSAHGSEVDWEVIATTARTVAEKLALPLKIVVDLPGPKIRTVALSPGFRALKLKVKRDPFGKVQAPSRIYLSAVVDPECSGQWLPVAEDVVRSLKVSDSVEFVDARGKHRTIVICDKPSPDRAIGTIANAAYVTSSTAVTVKSPAAKTKVRFALPLLPEKPFFFDIAVGERFLLVRSTYQKSKNRGPQLPALGCTLPKALANAKNGALVKIDDGKIEAKIVATSTQALTLQITRAPRGVARLKGDMGLSLPDLPTSVSALSADDLSALRFAEKHADSVAQSFVRSDRDVVALEKKLRRKDLGLILKIETREGFAALPKILLQALGKRSLGVMVARGDLAVECGFERLAEVQEEILWLCEAAHVPVIWATQVLENLAKTGMPTRAEITDAAASVRAECVMLNKGPYIEEAVKTLDSILKRMETHQYKKRQLYRQLKVATNTEVRRDKSKLS